MSTKNLVSAPKPDRITGLAPLIGAQPEILVLGSMPSVASLEKQQYYGHPRNAFWPLILKLLDCEPDLDYAQRVAQITSKGVAVWDVIGECQRPGSLDSAIVRGSERINPIPSLLAEHPSIRKIGLNGGMAATLFKRHCKAELDTQRIRVYPLPSTSPANARMNFEAKYDAWKVLF